SSMPKLRPFLNREMNRRITNTAARTVTAIVSRRSCGCWLSLRSAISTRRGKEPDKKEKEGRKEKSIDICHYYTNPSGRRKDPAKGRENPKYGWL
ncbi:hypothetical protein T310_7693, partial [Rasamsonia emersonii CBS 393.64]